MRHLALELEAFNVSVKLVEPGYGPSTSFTSNTGDRMNGLIPEPYAAFAQSGAMTRISPLCPLH